MLPILSLPLVIDIALYYCIYRTFKWLLSPYIFPQFRHIPGPTSQSWFKGNLGQLFNAKGLPFHQQLVDRFGGMVKVYGFFGDEQLYVSDPHALQSIIVKDQDAFEETAVFIDTNRVIFGPGLVSTTGDVHKKQRKIVAPVFSVPQLKKVTPIVYEIAEKLADVLTREVHASRTTKGSSVLDMSEWVSRIALETIGRTVLGYSFDPLDSPHNNPYTSAIKELIPTLFSLSVLRQFAPFLSRLGTPWLRRKIVDWTPNKAIQKIKNMSDIMDSTARSILREKQILMNKPDLYETNFGNVEEDKDIISVLLRANEKAAVGEKLSESELTGQMTCVPATRDFGIFEKTRVREEITAAFADVDRLGYDSISELAWLDAVVKETLRLATKEKTLVYSTSNSDTADASVIVPAGTTLFVGIAGANRLESVWGVDAKTWKPERWLSDRNPVTMHLPGIYSGMFALMEMKIILATLLRRFKFSSTNDEIIWNLSQIISPSVRRPSTINDSGFEEEKGLPMVVELTTEE
ncbi:hypothetical protein HHX47_DHR7000670 [Lentinula edodes]|nr:hypothetical protein HHX47_DHR7000670 [Lentinula edodes]